MSANRNSKKYNANYSGNFASQKSGLMTLRSGRPAPGKKSVNKGRRKSFSFAVCIALTLSSVPLLTDQDFDESKHLSAGCLNGNFECGLVAETQASLETVPADPANFIKHRGLPARIDLSADFPPAASQGRQNSCVGWATAYAVKSFHERTERRWNFNSGNSVSSRCGSGSSRVFSPAYVYNQINRGRDRGSSIRNAFNLMVREGVAPCSDMPYNVRDYLSKPGARARQVAAKFKGRSSKYVNCSNLNAVKAVLAGGNPLVGGFKVTADMYKVRSQVWDTFDGNVRGGHAMAVVGYDDSKVSPRGERGAFKLFNSWGTRWGRGGMGWISYGNMRRVCKYTYVMYDLQDSREDPEPEPDNTVKKLNPPEIVTASRGRYNDRIEVSWRKVDGALSYIVERNSPGGASFVRRGIARSPAFSDRAIQAGLAYRYRVVAVSDTARSDAGASPVAEGYAQKKEIVSLPERVQGLRGREIPGTSAPPVPTVQLDWGRASGAERYQVSRWDESSRKWKVLSMRVRGESYTDRSVVSGKLYYFTVRALNSQGKGRWSGSIRVRVSGSKIVTAKPARGERPNVSKGDFKDRIEIRWRPIGGASSYKLARYDLSSRRWRRLGTVRGTFYKDTSEVVMDGTTYYYSIAGVNRLGRGAWSLVSGGNVNRTEFRGDLPPAVEGLRGNVDPENGMVRLRWKRNKKTHEYYVFRRGEDESEYRYIKSVDRRTVFFTEKLPGKDKIYYYTVRSKALLGGESSNARPGPVVAFINTSLNAPLVKRRLDPADGLERFGGQWKASDLKARSASRLTLSVKNAGPKFSVTIGRDGKTISTVRGNYAAKSDYLESRGFRMRLLPGPGKFARVRFSNPKVFPEYLEITFEN